MTRNLTKLVLAALTLLLLQQVVLADVIKMFAFTGRQADPINEVAYTYNLDTDKNAQFNPRAVDPVAFLAGQPSNVFTGVSGIGGKTLDFKGTGEIKKTEVDKYVARFSGDLTPDASVLIKSLTETTTKGNSMTVAPAKKALDNLQFAIRVAGFTNNEYFVLVPGQTGFLHLLNALVGVTYDIKGLKVYANLPISNFNLVDWMTIPNGVSPVYTNSDLNLVNGSDAAISLGTILPGTYALAVADQVEVTDDSTGTVYTFAGPLGFAQNAVPEPSTVALFAFGSLMLGGFAWKRRNAQSAV
jgi:hypothetical protein